MASINNIHYSLINVLIGGEEAVQEIMESRELLARLHDLQTGMWKIGICFDILEVERHLAGDNTWKNATRTVL